MRNPISATVALLAILAASAQAQSERGSPLVPYFAYCRSDAMIGKTFYFSATRPINAGVAREDLQKSFRDFLATKYKYPNTSAVSCVFATGTDLQARTESNRKETINNLHSANYDVVETDWTFTK